VRKAFKGDSADENRNGKGMADGRALPVVTGSHAVLPQSDRHDRANLAFGDVAYYV